MTVKSNKVTADNSCGEAARFQRTARILPCSHTEVPVNYAINDGMGKRVGTPQKETVSETQLTGEC